MVFPVKLFSKKIFFTVVKYTENSASQPFLSAIKYSAIKYIHITVQPSPPSTPRTSLGKLKPVPTELLLPSPLPTLAPQFNFCFYVCFLAAPPGSGISQYLPFCDGLTSLSSVSVGPIPLQPGQSSLPLYVLTASVHWPPVDGHLCASTF